MYVVASGVVTLLFVHCTTEQGRRFVPVTDNVTAAVPAVAFVGEMVAIVGAGSDEGEIVKGKAFERAPELDTSTFTVPAEAISETGMMAVSCVGLTNVVASTGGTGGGGLTTHSTTELFTKFVPFTVRVTPEELHAAVVFDEVVEETREETVGGTIMNESGVEAGLPVLIAETCAATCWNNVGSWQ
jgi:hypothetical protein